MSGEGIGRVWVNTTAVENIARGALHIYAQNVERVDASPGDWVEVLHGGETLAYGFYSPSSSIPVKVYSWEDEDPREVILQRLEWLWKRKRRLYPTTFRHVFAEGDLVPGLIVDVYGLEVAALKVNVLGLERFKEDIADFLVEKGVENVVERNEGKGRKKEGLPLRKGLLRGKTYRSVIKEGNVEFIVDVLKGQKTGFYLDQRENRVFSEKIGEGRALDVFSYTGGFGVHLAAAGASVTFVEMGKWESGMIEKNLELNGVEGRVIRGDAVDVLKRLLEQRESFDVVSLDPPALAKERRDVEKAKRMYFLLNRLAIRLLKPGGILLSSSCTHFLSPREFLGIVRGAAQKEGRRLRMLGSLRGQAPDHTVYLPQPETQYLKHGVFEVE